MTIHASVHTDPATQYETHATTITGHGYVRIKPDADDELDPPTYDDAYDAALLASYGCINDLYENSPRMGETE